jgi:hypothetical protein
MAGLFRQNQLPAFGHLQAITVRTVQNPNFGLAGKEELLAFDLAPRHSFFGRQRLGLIGFHGIPSLEAHDYLILKIIIIIS